MILYSFHFLDAVSCSLERSVACHRSPEDDAAARFRRIGVGENELIIVEGGDAPV